MQPQKKNSFSRTMERKTTKMPDKVKNNALIIGMIRKAYTVKKDARVQDEKRFHRFSLQRCFLEEHPLFLQTGNKK